FLLVNIALFSVVRSRLSALSQAKPRLNFIVIGLGCLSLIAFSFLLAIAASDSRGFYTLAIWFALIAIVQVVFIISADRAIFVEQKKARATSELLTTLTRLEQESR